MKNTIIAITIALTLIPYAVDKFVYDWTPVWHSYTMSAADQALDCDMNGEYYTINNNMPAYCN